MEHEACQFKATQGSKQATRSRNLARRRRTTCYCGKRPVLATSSTAENPGWKFWGCVNFGMSFSHVGEECGYFVWAEPEEDPSQVSRLRLKVRNLKGKLDMVEFRFMVAVGVALVGWTLALILVFEKTTATKFGRLSLE
ncbi:uncharacterized protein DS421_17g590470 [Arachis hypogaea]|uniref:GRF-type domain-containing protein n=1 Tax=Arachis hypogaea TaxID=3818 RepID=A0A445CD28_ARAHY|nr:uncharacterized protein DS421_17g590470 [Arachis hypogaea]RYR48731.1 hypothetical protein Ahy_A07g034806 [Arachis hypogaea]